MELLPFACLLFYAVTISKHFELEVKLPQNNIKMNIQKVSQALCCIVIGLLCSFLNDKTIGHSASIKLVIIGIIVIVLFILQYKK